MINNYADNKSSYVLGACPPHNVTDIYDKNNKNKLGNMDNMNNMNNINNCRQIEMP